MRSIRTILFLAVAVVLAGCVVSRDPLISASGAAMPLEPGAYRGGSTEENMTDAVTVLRKQGEYVATKISVTKEEGKPDKKEATTYVLRFHQLDGDHFVAQLQPVEKTATEYTYLYVHVEPSAVKFYAARCDKLLHSSRMLRAYGMTKAKGERERCEVKTTENLLAFMRDIPFNSHFRDFTSLEYVIAR